MGLALRNWLVKGRNRPGEIGELTNDVRSVVLYEVSDFRGVAAVDDPAGLCRLIESFLDFCAEFVCGAGLPVRLPMEGIQAGMRYIQ